MFLTITDVKQSIKDHDRSIIDLKLLIKDDLHQMAVTRRLIERRSRKLDSR